ncbi:MAG TPA: hypothetical protein VNG53_03220 [Bacteroidia bacterium]|nr:hypothetical protein [Bacteroidia bacterium]
MKTSKTNFLKIVSKSVLVLFLVTNSVVAQTDTTATNQPEAANSPKGGTEKLFLAGEAFTIWQSSHVQGYPSTNSFGADPLGLMIMPLVKLNDRLFLDAQVAVAANPIGGGAGVSLNELIISYKVLPGVYLFGGNFQPRWGLFEGILDDFTNRFCTDPVGMGLGAQTESGIGIQGGLQTGYSKINYQLYIANGPQLIVDSTGQQNGVLDYSNYTDNNKNKAIGGTIGYLPFSNSGLELDASGQYTAKTGGTGTVFENISSTSWAASLNYFHVFNPIMVRVIGQYENTQTQNYNLYTNETKTTLLVPSFNNQLSGWYAGMTFRASGSQSIFLSNLELGGRLGSLSLPNDAIWGGKPINQTTLCLTYWLTWKAPINIAYDIYTQAGSPNQNVITVRGMWYF